MAATMTATAARATRVRVTVPSLKEIEKAMVGHTLRLIYKGFIMRSGKIWNVEIRKIWCDEVMREVNSLVIHFRDTDGFLYTHIEHLAVVPAILRDGYFDHSMTDTRVELH